MKNPTILAIDVGNSSIHWNIIKDSNFDSYTRNKHIELSLLPWEAVKKINIPVVIAGALPHINEAAKEIADDHKITFHEINLTNQQIIRDTYPTLGIDRVCNLIGALKLFKNPEAPIIVFDFGSATTMTACDQNGNFLGGIIRTGFEVELKGISSKTLSLPHVELAKEQKITELNPLTHSTEDAILHGVIIGQIAFIKYSLNLLKTKIQKEPKVIITGGNSSIVSRFYKDYDLMDPCITLKGIYHCFQGSLSLV